MTTIDVNDAFNVYLVALNYAKKCLLLMYLKVHIMMNANKSTRFKQLRREHYYLSHKLHHVTILNASDSMLMMMYF